MPLSPICGLPKGEDGLSHQTCVSPIRPVAPNGAGPAAPFTGPSTKLKHRAPRSETIRNFKAVIAEH